MKFFYLIWRNLMRKKVRTLLTVSCILIAFLLFGYLSAIKQAFNMGVDVAGADRLVIRHKVSLIQPLPESYLARIARLDGVDAVMHQTWFGGVYQEPKNFFPQIPVEPAALLDMYPEYVLPEEQKQGWLENRIGAIVGETTAERFGWEVGDRIPIQATIWPKRDGDLTWEFVIEGIFTGADKGVDTSPLYFRYDYFEESRTEEADGLVGWYVVRVDSPQQATEVAESIDAEFANSFAETKAETEGAFVQGFAKQVGDIATMVTAILSAVFFTILLVAGNTMAQAVRERVAELSVLKALGFTHSGVLWLVLAESCLLSVLGGGTGLALAWLATSGGDPTGGALPVFFFPVADLVLGIVFVLLLGIVVGIFPALQAMRLQVAVGLRR